MNPVHWFFVFSMLLLCGCEQATTAAGKKAVTISVEPLVFEAVSERFLYAEYRVESPIGGFLTYEVAPSETTGVSLSRGGSYVLHILRDFKSDSRNLISWEGLQGGKDGDHLTSGNGLKLTHISPDQKGTAFKYEQLLPKRRILGQDGERMELVRITGPGEQVWTVRVALGREPEAK